MAVAAVTSPDPFTFHPHVSSPSAADVDGDEFEFRVPAAAAAVLSAADELFCGGKLVPLLPPPQPSSPPCGLEVEPASEPGSPRAPRCAGRRWRDLLLLVSKKAKPGGSGDETKRADGCLKRRELHFRPLLSRDSSSSSSTSSVDSSKTARRDGAPPPSRSPLRTRSAPVASLLHLVSRRPAGAKTGAADADASAVPKQQEPCAHQLLTRASSSSSASSSDSYGRNGPLAPSSRPRGPARPRRPAVAAESPRVSASGRVLFRGLERCSSTPASAGIGPVRRPGPRGMERSYSVNVRVDPVINVFGFGQLFMPSSPAKERRADRERDGAGRRNRPEKLSLVLRDPQD